MRFITVQKKFTIQNVPIKYWTKIFKAHFWFHLQYKMFLLNVNYYKESVDIVGFTIQNVPIKWYI